MYQQAVGLEDDAYADKEVLVTVSWYLILLSVLHRKSDLTFAFWY